MNKASLICTIVLAAVTQHTSSAAERGNIIDRNGSVIATDTGTGNRSYPAAEATAHLTGYCKPGDNLQGVTGLEKAFDASLKNGEAIRLNIDRQLQQSTYEILKESGRPGAAVIIEPHTGKILTLVSYPSYDPAVLSSGISEKDFAALRDAQDAPFLSRATMCPYPPSSTFKTFTSVALRQYGKGTPQTCSGKTEIGDNHYRCWKSSGHGNLPTVREALCVSCNCYYYQAVLADLSMEQVTKTARGFGFGTASGIEIADVAGTLPGPDDQSDLPVACIGHGSTSATTLQIANAFATFANGGTLYQPQLIAGKEPVVVSRIADSGIDPKHFEIVTKGLIDVVESQAGTGRLAEVNGLKVAGKTGSGTLSGNRYVGIFGGFAPVEAPRYAICVVQESKPGESSVPGGRVAAPVASKILAKAEVLRKAAR